MRTLSTGQFLMASIVPALFLATIIFLFYDIEMYESFAAEDNIIENLTFLLLLLAGILALYAGQQQWRKWRANSLWTIGIGLLLILGALEEISWGQRVLEIETAEVFEIYSDQPETNIHNLFQGISGMKTREILGVLLVIYGGILPMVISKPGLAGMLVIFPIPLSPLYLAPSYFLGLPLMFDLFSGRSEEYGEFLFAMCLFLSAIYWKSTVTTSSIAYDLK
jgi:hypothetical protein